jgi:peroxin-6
MLVWFSFQSIDEKFVKDISVQTSGFMPRDILALVADAGVSFAHKVAVEESSNDKLEDSIDASSSTTQNEENKFSKEDILSSLERAKKRNRAALGTPKVKH